LFPGSYASKNIGRHSRYVRELLDLSKKFRNMRTGDFAHDVWFPVLKFSQKSVQSHLARTSFGGYFTSRVASHITA
jgi:hypothetical protein